MIKKLFYLLAFIILFLSLSFLREVFFSNRGYANNFFAAVVQISSAKLKSYITYFDKNLNEISTQQINHGGLAHFWDFPKFSDGKIFMNVKGTDLWLKKQIMVLDLDNGKYHLYSTKQKFNNCLAVDSKSENFYTTNCDGNSNILRYNIATRSIKKLVIKNFYVTHMNVVDDDKNLLVFGNSLGDINFSCFMYIVDPKQMSIKRKIDITTYGFGQYDSKKVGNYIFFASNINHLIEDDSVDDESTLCKYNLETNKIVKIKLKSSHPKQILLYKNKLIISHEDWHQNGSSLSIYNLASHKISNIQLTNAPYQITICENRILVEDGKFLCKYNADNLTLEKKIRFDTQKKFGNDFFVSAIFTNGK